MKKSELRQLIKEEISKEMKYSSKIKRSLKEAPKEYDFDMGIIDDIQGDLDNGDWESAGDVVEYLDTIRAWCVMTMKDYKKGGEMYDVFNDDY